MGRTACTAKHARAPMGGHGMTTNALAMLRPWMREVLEIR